MKHALLLSLGLAAAAAMPAFADGYKDAPEPNRGPAPLSAQEQETHRHTGENVKIVRVRHEAGPASQVSSCGCCCAPVSYSRTYTTEPVVVRHYTRTYTRMAPPSCAYGSHSSHGHHHRKHHHGDRYHHEGRYQHDSRYEDGRRAYDGAYANGPVYRENTVIWSSDGSHRDRTGYTARRDEYSYYQAKHGSPRIIYRD